MEDTLESGPFEPWILLPTQLGGEAPWANTTSGPIALMLAVLEDAIRCLERGRRCRRPSVRKLAADADAWMRCDSREWPFAFASICDVLGVDVDAARASLLRTGEHYAEAARPRSAVRRSGHGRGRMMVCAPRATSRAA